MAIMFKTNWKNNSQEAKKKVQRNENLTKQEKHFFNIILSSRLLFRNFRSVEDQKYIKEFIWIAGMILYWVII